MLKQTLLISMVATFTGVAIADSREAAPAEPFYFGFGGGISFLEPESDSSALSLEEDSDLGYKLIGGYQVTRNLGVEVYWADLGAAELGSVSGNSTDIEYSTFGIGGVYGFPLDDRWSMIAKAGIGRLENDAGDLALDVVNENFVFVGAGAAWAITDTWDLRAEYEYFDSDTQFLSVNIIKRFGAGNDRRVYDLERQIEEQERQLAELAGLVAATNVPESTPPIVPEIACISGPIELQGVDFDYRSIELTEASMRRLDEVIAKITALPADVRIEVRAHTDSIGTETYNYVLSLSRARNVRDYIVNNGISLDRIEAKGYGELHPVASNETEQGRKRNRRAEMVLLGMDKYTEGSGACAGPGSSIQE